LTEDNQDYKDHDSKPWQDLIQKNPFGNMTEGSVVSMVSLDQNVFENQESRPFTSKNQDTENIEYDESLAINSEEEHIYENEQPQKLDSSQEEELSINENHSCEDEELVI
jgi:hypothetical protein